jgi:hypothetical protein
MARLCGVTGQLENITEYNWLSAVRSYGSRPMAHQDAKANVSYEL